MAPRTYHLVADITSADPETIHLVLRRLLDGEITPTQHGFHVAATLTGESARDLNRTFLSALRAVERRTTLRASWTADGVSERFFDYVPKRRVGFTLEAAPAVSEPDHEPAPRLPGWLPCMSKQEFDRWSETNRSTALQGRAHQAISPCEDCTPAFAEEMRRAGRCDGWPGAPGPAS